MTAEEAFDDLIVGKNVMTPDRIECEYLPDGRIYELCTGWGFTQQLMWAVSVADPDRPAEIVDSGLFNQEKKAREFIMELGGE